MLQLKKHAATKQDQRHLANMIEQKRLQFARIKCEQLIRDDSFVEMLSLIELFCELFLSRFKFFEQAESDSGLDESIQTIIYAAPQCEVRELLQVRELLLAILGKEYVLTAVQNSENKVNKRVFELLEVKPIKENVIEAYLFEIAKAYGVEEELPAEMRTEFEKDHKNSSNLSVTGESNSALKNQVPAKPSSDIVEKAASEINSKSQKDAEESVEEPDAQSSTASSARSDIKAVDAPASEDSSQNFTSQENNDSLENLYARFQALKKR